MMLSRYIGAITVPILSVWLFSPAPARADNAQVARGKYLVELACCGHCHTPGHFLGKTDTTRLLAGSDVGLQGPAGEVVLGSNLTPDKETGLGRWTIAQISRAITSGVRPDGRVLSPLMPWSDFHSLRAADVTAIALYLKSLPPVKNVIPGPYAPRDRVPLPRLELVFPDTMR
jgi:mono/diheme cytochrome c family protein